MAYLKIDKKLSEHYLRMLESKRKGKKVVKKDLYNLGKVENFSPGELAAIGKKLLQLSGYTPEDINKFQELNNTGHYNYGYQLLKQKLGCGNITIV
jgi:hypothetical protein